MKHIYLACPYYHFDPEIREFRFKTACKVAAELIRRKLIVFSPISHSHPINDIGGLEMVASYGLWMMQDLPLVKWADELWVISLNGWTSSRGVKIEISYALKLDKPVHFVNPMTLEVT